jgi:hypothetical protein
VLFVYGYSKTAGSDRLWLISAMVTAPIEPNKEVSVDVSASVGTSGTLSKPIPGSALVKWGTIKMKFSDAMKGTFTVSGKDGTKTFNVVRLAGIKTAPRKDLTQVMYDPAYDGSGFNLIESDSGLFIFFYGYGKSGKRLWLISDAIDNVVFGSQITVNMQVGPLAAGGSFQVPVPSVQLEKWGTLKAQFSSKSKATFTLTGTDGTVTHAVQTLVTVSSAALPEAAGDTERSVTGVSSPSSINYWSAVFLVVGVVIGALLIIVLNKVTQTRKGSRKGNSEPLLMSEINSF